MKRVIKVRNHDLCSNIDERRGTLFPVVNVQLTYHFYPPRQHEPLVVNGEQQGTVVLGIP